MTGFHSHVTFVVEQIMVVIMLYDLCNFCLNLHFEAIPTIPVKELEKPLIPFMKYLHFLWF